MNFTDDKRKWFDGFLFYLGRNYPEVLKDILVKNLKHEKDHKIMIERYINHKTINEIADIVFIEPRHVNTRKQKSLDILLSLKLA